MIFQLAFGFLVSGAVIVLFKAIHYTEAANAWILAISKFVYIGGHPLLDDDEKFKQLTKRYKSVALSLLTLIIKTILIVLFAVSVIALIAAGGGLVQGNTLPGFHSPQLLSFLFPGYLLQWPFIVGTLLPLALLPFLPKTASEDYSAMEKFLHYLFLGNTVMAKLQFRLECFLNKKMIRSTAPSQHVYVAGLARSGSTSLMQYLGQLPDFVSLSYLNMPFIFMPRSGPKLISKKRAKEKERSHQDGMMHSLSTYEALEEPFWLHTVGADYVAEDHLTHHCITKGVHDQYQKFRTLVAKEKTYLAKNNNHLLRAASLHQLDAEMDLRTRTIIPFREPRSQAKSLLQQHRILSSLQSENNFALDYMDFLVHHEFGLHVKTFFLAGETGDTLPQGDQDSVEYWLNVWYLFYDKALGLYEGAPGFCFFCYENYRNNPRGALLSLSSFINVASEQMESIEVKEWAGRSSEQALQPDDKFTALYNRMAQVAINHEN